MNILSGNNQTISTGVQTGPPCTRSWTNHIQLLSSKHITVMFTSTQISSHRFVDLPGGHLLSCFPIMQTSIHFLHPSYLFILHFTITTDLNLTTQVTPLKYRLKYLLNTILFTNFKYMLFRRSKRLCPTTTEKKLNKKWSYRLASRA
jgi:hypothetical protein